MLPLAGRTGRIVVMLATAFLFGGPLLWLLLAPTKTTEQLNGDFPLSFGSFSQVGTAWDNLMTFNDGQILVWLQNSVVYSAASVALAIVLCLPAGYALATYSFPGRKLLLTLTLLTMIVPQAALVLPLFLEMAELRLIDTPWAVILPSALFPFGVYLAYLHFAAALPPSLLDAGRIDGASEWQLFRRIALPLSKPAVALIGFFSFTAVWNNYFLPFIMLSDDSRYTLQIGLQTLLSSTPAVNPARGLGDLPIQAPEAALAALLTAAPVLIVFLFSQRFLVAGQLAGAEKG
jgi:multiple sugar transport system permease protein